MNGVQITVPAELLEAAGVNPADASRESARLLALELYREHKVSLGRAAELCDMPIEAFMVFAGKRGASMHYSVSDLEEDRLTLERLSA
jgi:predicted HTH domain antitoxin